MNNQQAHERIHKLLHDGKINPEEATALLEALHDGDTASSANTDTDTDTGVSVTSHSTSSTAPSTTLPSTTPHNSAEAASTHTPMTPPDPPQPPTPPQTHHKSQPEESQHEVEINLNGTIGNAVSEVFSRGFRYAFGVAPDGTASSIPNPDLDAMPDAPFVYVHNRLGNVTIKVDATLTEPSITPKAEANNEADETDAEDIEDNAKADIFRPHDQDDNYPEDVFMVRLLARANSTLHVPEGYAVYLDSGAGNVRIDGVASVFGTVNAGNAKITGVTSLNMVVNAGNAKVSGRFDRGEHKLVTNAGNAKVMLQDGSSLTVNARVSAGNIKHKGDWQDVTVVREMVSSKLEGRIHTGDAVITLKAKAGNISVHAPDGTSSDNITDDTGDDTGDDNDD